MALSSPSASKHVWKVSDSETINLIKSKKCVYESSYRMHGFCWQLAFRAQRKGTEEATLFLHLVSLPPKVSRVVVDYKMTLQQLNSIFQKCNSFDENNDSWGWNDGTCSSAAALKLSRYTFEIDMKLAAVYGKDGEDLTDLYINKASKSAQSTSSLKLAESLQSLIVGMDSLTAAMESVQNKVIALETRMDEEEKGNVNDLQQQIDDMKASLQKLTVKSDVIEENTEEAIFKKWVVNTLKYPEYYELFVENGVDTLNVAKLLTKSELKAIGINKIGHQLKIMEEIQAYKQNEQKPSAPAYQQPVEGGTLVI